MSTVHVLPDWQNHSPNPFCWCGPSKEPVPPNGELWVHRAANDDEPIYDPAKDPAVADPNRHWLVLEAT